MSYVIAEQLDKLKTDLVETIYEVGNNQPTGLTAEDINLGIGQGLHRIAEAIEDYVLYLKAKDAENTYNNA